MENTMATLDAESSRERDRHFAEKIHARDESVIAELDAAYAGRIHRLLRSRLQPADIDVVIQSSLLAIWKDFRIDGGNTVAGLLFQVAKRKAVDVLRQLYRDKHRLERVGLTKRDSDFEDRDTPAKQLEAEEQKQSDRDLLSRIEEACDELSSKRQQTAFRRRFLTECNTNWAKELESETQIPAKTWRKTSDDAKKKVLKVLAENGTVFREGERHEVA